MCALSKNNVKIKSRTNPAGHFLCLWSHSHVWCWTCIWSKLRGDNVTKSVIIIIFSLPPAHREQNHFIVLPVHDLILRCETSPAGNTSSSFHLLCSPSPSFFFCVLFGLVHFDWPSHVARLPNDWPALLMTSSLRVLGSIAVWRNEIRLSCMSVSQPCGIYGGGVNVTQEWWRTTAFLNKLSDPESEKKIEKKEYR